MEPFANRLSNILIGADVDDASLATGPLELVLGKWRLSISCSWRYADSEGLIGSGDGTDKATIKNELLGRRIVTVSVISRWHDLIIGFDDGCQLSVWADSGTYESWHLSALTGEMIVVGPGAESSEFGPGPDRAS